MPDDSLADEPAPAWTEATNPQSAFAIDAVVAQKINFAAQQNATPVLRELRLANLRDVAAERLVLEVDSDPPVFAPHAWRFDRLGPLAEVQVRDRDLPLNAGYLQQLSEAVKAEVRIRVREDHPDTPVLVERRFEVEVLARNEWGGAVAQPELLPAFVLPNDPAVSRLLKGAADVLARAGKRDALDGYQSRSKDRVYELASALWSATTGLRLTYAEPPASFELQGQKVRTPSAILEAGLATCLDTALLMAAALEQIGLYPILVLTRGHAFVGVWLQPQEFATLLVEDAAALRKRVALHELVLFETTLATGARPASFAKAQAEADRQIAEEHESDFVMAVDVRRGRLQRIKPLALALTTQVSVSPTPEVDAAAYDLALEPAPELGGFDLADPDIEASSSPEGRLQRWQRKLLDLTTRNRLLNVQPGPNAIKLLCPEPALLEDRLADGTSFRIVPSPDLVGGAGRDGGLHTQRTGEDLLVEVARGALERDEIISPLPSDKLEAQLTDLYRKARLDLAEGGANTLFLAVGFLAWKKTPTDPKSYRAPLILVPVQLERRSVRAGVKLRIHEDEPRFNLTLLQMLRQDFDLDIPELATTLPSDGSGVDVPKVLNLVRRAVRDTPGFEVFDEVILGAFSFAKYLMWKDMVDRTDALKRNPVVHHLLETPRDRYVCADEPPLPEKLDAVISPGDLFAPLPADSSQLAAVIGSARRCDFVLNGPPGTGKSQTIANMIAHNLALGRRVLFVAEKRAALDVVRRRLNQHGLGPFCLELHSNKASKGDVLRQLDDAWSTRETIDQGEWDRRAVELKLSRDGLNELVQALHQVRPNGLTVYQAVGRVVRDGARQALRLDWPHTQDHDVGRLEALREAARRLDLHRPPPTDAQDPGLTRVGRSEWSPLWQTNLLAAAGELARASDGAAQRRDELLKLLGVVLEGDGHGLAALTGLTIALDAAAGLDLRFGFSPDAKGIAEVANEAISSIETYRGAAQSLSAPLQPAAVRTLPLEGLQRDWDAANRALWPFSVLKKSAIAKQINPGAKSDPGADLPLIRLMQAELVKLDRLATEGVAEVPGWAGLESDIARLKRNLEAAAGLRSAIVSAASTPDRLIKLRAALRRLCVDGADLLAPEGAVGRACALWREAYALFRVALDAFESLASSPTPFQAQDIPAEAGRIACALLARPERLNAWCAWRRARTAALDLDLGKLVAALEDGAISEAGAAEAFETAYARWWSEVMVEQLPVVRTFTVAAQVDAIERFQALEDRFAELTRLYIRAKLSGQIPQREDKSQPAGFGVLSHQLRLQRRQKPVRQLVAEMGRALTTLTPCLLMSPLSVAQYLPPDAELFDLVIFDEASQITPWDAIGAIARGKQLVVAGDPKQMPPTSFFERGAGAQDDDSDVEEDQESILDECLSAGLPQRQLTWHYRSRNESLIAFSNHRYYHGELITFPAPVVRDDAVRLRQVPGAWSRGKARTNQIEAQALVAEVVTRLRDPAFVDENGKGLSLAVITLNAEQQKLVEDLLDRARRADPSLERFFADDIAEPVVVKNLETVQGDERDLILLGIGYGPETTGAPVMAMNFGPLNRKGGWRRLNVAVTRARREMVVFSSFPPTLIDLNRSSAEAVRDLKHFMEFAERGPRALGEAVAGSVGGFDSPFEQAVARGLRERGWTVVSQIGVSRFRIDLGVVHPDRPGDYLCGVECDGASYHSGATARDRDKVREGVLKGLGWSLVRVWSTDWWIDPRGALDRLVAALEAVLAEARERERVQAEPLATQPAPQAPASEDIIADEDLSADQPGEDGWTVEPGGEYRVTTFADMTDRLDADQFQDSAYTPVLREMVARIIATEAPIRDDLLVARVARAHGIKRNGRHVRERVLAIARGSAHVHLEGRDDAFVWPDVGSVETWASARFPARNDDIRQIEDIALAELGAALRDCLSVDVATEAARKFGVRRLSASARTRLAKAAPPKGHFSA